MINRLNLASVVAVVASGAAGEAQGVTARSLKQAEVKLEAEFTAIGSARELKDGRVLIADPNENRLVVADLRAGTVAAVGRVGSGPEEYRRLGKLFALANDSTLLPDPGNGRWLLLHGARIVRVLPSRSAGLDLGTLIGADSSGHVLVEKYPRRNWNEADAATESVYVIRGNRTTGIGDTIARVLSHPVKIEHSTAASDAPPRVYEQPFSAAEQAGMFPDGVVAIARVFPYRVDQIHPGGIPVRGKALSHEPSKVDAAEKRAYMERIARATGKEVRGASYFPVWPHEAYPFRDDGLLTAPGGVVLVLRMQTRISPETRYDVIDQTAQLVGRITLPENQRIVGFGVRSVYVAVTDDVGIQRLVRHPWP